MINLEVLVRPIVAPPIQPIVRRFPQRRRPPVPTLHIRDISVVPRRYERQPPFQEAAILLDRPPRRVGLLAANMPSHLRPLEQSRTRY